ncbi:hypothetical protein G4B88_019104 [Cannabis sativa]|uniref:Uncharacterized protein n=1 Tax=Cannabis sativa TaxID=3483 RepID=A0A7J6H134_CANSA|nr:hypothetical protein G4B88_019104 [Cannabis sativa]
MKKIIVKTEEERGMDYGSNKEVTRKHRWSPRFAWSMTHSGHVGHDKRLALKNLLSSSPHQSSSISHVHHLIEECIVFNLSKEECMEALSKHANIKPLITSTVWKELEKENKEFFEAYAMKMKDQDPDDDNKSRGTESRSSS